MALTSGPGSDVVVPHAGTWIEITDTGARPSLYCVVPHAGTWIEITKTEHILTQVSLVPHAGTWIEIQTGKVLQMHRPGRSPRGNVD